MRNSPASTRVPPHISLRSRPRQATCENKNGAAADATAVTDADCGTGFVYQSSQSAAPCAGVECVPGTTDQATCCVAQATCGDKNGAAAGATAVTDADCGIGFKYTAALGSNLCAGSVCVAATTDQAACCVVRGAASAQLTDLTFKEASCKLLYSRISTLYYVMSVFHTCFRRKNLMAPHTFAHSRSARLSLRSTHLSGCALLTRSAAARRGLGPEPSGHGCGDGQVGRHRRLGCERRRGLQPRLFKAPEQGRWFVHGKRQPRS